MVQRVDFEQIRQLLCPATVSLLAFNDEINHLIANTFHNLFVASAFKQPVKIFVTETGHYAAPAFENSCISSRPHKNIISPLFSY